MSSAVLANEDGPAATFIAAVLRAVRFSAPRISGAPALFAKAFLLQYKQALMQLPPWLRAAFFVPR